MKKIKLIVVAIISVTVIILGTVFIAVSQNAETPVTFSVSVAECELGENAAVYLSVDENVGISGASLNLVFDENRLELISAEPIQREGMGIWNINSAIAAGSIRFTFTDSFGDCEGTGEILKLIFRLKSSSVDMAAVSLLIEDNALFGSDYKPLKYTGVNGGIVTVNAENRLILDAYSDYRLNREDGLLLNVRENTDTVTLRDAFTNYDTVVLALDGKPLSSGKYVGSGCVIAINRGPNDYPDRLTVIVRGDTDGDGMITVTDYLQIKRYFTGTHALNDLEFFAADTDSDGFIGTSDYLRIKRHFQKKYNLW